MNFGLIASFILILGFFYLSGSGFTVLLLPSKWWNGYWSFTIFPILGIVVQLVLAAVLIPRGIEIELSVLLVTCLSCLILIIYLVKKILGSSVRDLFQRLTINHSSRFILPGSLIFVSLLPVLFINSGVVMNVRLGIDAALYADGAQSLLAHENQPTLSNIANLHPGSLGTALFFQAYRWGSAFLLAMCSVVTSSPHSLSIGVPLFAVVLFLIAGLTLRILSSRIETPVIILVTAVALTGGNTFLVRLLTEGQWPNLLAILILVFLIYLIMNQYENFEDTSTRVRLNILGAAACCSILITYAEILPLMLVIIILTHTISSFVFRRNHFFVSLFLNLIPLISASYIFFMLSNPALIAYFKFLILPSYANVGYPSPRAIFPSDMLGLTDLWASPTRWLSFDQSVKRLESPDLIGLSIVNILLMILIGSIIWFSIKFRFQKVPNFKNNLRRKSVVQNGKILTFSILMCVSMSALLVYSWLSSQLIQKSDYILLKASSILLVPLIIEVLSLVSLKAYKMGNSRTQLSKILLALITSLVIFVNIQNLIQLKSNSAPLSTGNLIKTWDKNSKFECAYLFNKRGARADLLRYVDRTADYYMDSVFRGDIILDPWTNQSLERPVDPKVLSSRNVCVVFRRPFPPSINAEGLKLIFEDNDWKVFDTQMTYSNAVTKYGALENLQAFIQP